ncbi:tetratricopeptide repeat protein [Photobacterium lipolyticum]|uniref:Sel1 repeat family protein n=1 Tax=Photobacterium lipolyticum TaxID=266810 RepID=A0A2T3MWQ7_9GAMM|nr:tetratricopeptide repeat protein [Photobacterium lipolyticum]PSW04400.1 sel1 repeat family protein [Photobacterium lipolyticum]
MSDIVMGLGLLGIPLIWLVIRYFIVSKKQQEAARLQALKDRKYRLVLEKAKISEREEKIFKGQTGHIPSQLSLAKEYELTNIREAVNWYQKAADLGNEIGQHALARLCRQDVDDPQGEAKSQYWDAVVRSKQKEPEALFNLGHCLLQGHGVDVDFDAGIENMTAAAEMEYIPAQLFLGDWFVADPNPEKNPHHAFCWRLRAARNNDVAGFMKTAYCYQTGVAVKKDKQCAIYWLERAAEQGNTEAQYLAAKMHVGSDVNDAAVAYVWFSIAYASGNKEAKKDRDRVAQAIGIESIMSVQSVAKSVYKILQDKPVAKHLVIHLLDNMYGRSGYYPSDEQLDALLDEESTVGEEPANTVPTDGYSAEIPLTEQSDQEGSTCKSEVEISSVADNNATATQQYQQQSWVTSWDTLIAETEAKSDKS